MADDYSLDSYDPDEMENSLSTVAEEGIEISESGEIPAGGAPKSLLFSAQNQRGWPEDDFMARSASLNDVEQAGFGEGEEYGIEEFENTADTFADDDGAEPTQRSRKRPKKLALLLLCLLLVAGVVIVVVGAQKSLFFDDPQDNTQTTENQLIGSGSEQSGAGDNTDQSSAEVDGEVDAEVDSEVPSESPSTSPSFSPTTSPTPLPSSAPTPSPTPTPTPTTSPSGPPSASPSECVDSISTDAFCYQRNSGASVTVTFAQCNPRADDWIGIYVDGSDGQSLSEDYLDWSWACGTKTCQGETFANTIDLSANIIPGFYQVFIVIDSPTGAPYNSVAASQTFIVTDDECP